MMKLVERVIDSTFPLLIANSAYNINATLLLFLAVTIYLFTSVKYLFTKYTILVCIMY